MTTRHQRNLSKRQAQAVTKIQAVFRGYQCRLDLEEKHVAATRIQTQFRGYLTRSKIQSQTVYRSKNSRINAQLLQTQQKINALEKEMQSLSLASRTRVWESERRDRAARIIQKHVRGHLLRRSFMSRPVSPTKSIHERVAEEEDARVKVRDLLKLSNDTDDVDLVRHTVSSIHRRVLNDQFRHDRLYASLGKIHHEDDQIGPVLDQLETTAAQTTNLVAKLKTLGGLLDDYYSPVQNPGLAGVSMRSDGLLRECIQLRQETDSYLDTMNAGKEFPAY